MNKSKGDNHRNPSNWKARGFKSSTEDSDAASLPFATGTNLIPVNRALSSKRKFKTTADTPSNEKIPKIDAPVENLSPVIPLKIKKKKKISKNPGATEKTGSNQTETLEGEEKSTQAKHKRQKQKFKSYVLFIGNLSYETTKQDIMDHFGKCGAIKNVRIPVGKEDNKPRGFVYLEVEEHVTYENVLSMHHSFLRRRRINVECTFGGSQKSQKRKALIKEKTLKMRFLSREGKISSAKLKQWGKKKVNGGPKTAAES